MRRAAVEGVAAYLADKDADVYNITDAAVREDAVAAALNLTVLAAAAVTALADATGRTPFEALRSIDEAGFGEVSRQPRPAR
jgi:Pyruvate/2-oxoacid:ferredoxin oxidoreductase gamma subunit